jgi:hypothetical protein
MKGVKVVCSCCYDPVVYPEDFEVKLLPVQIVVQGNEIPTFESEPADHAHRFSTTRISHEVLEKCGMEYRDIIFSFPDRKPRKSLPAAWHMPDGRPITPCGLYGGVQSCLVKKGCVEVLPTR